MAILRAILIIVEVLTSVLMIGVILLQKAKDEGLGLAFGAAVGETLFGSRAGNVLTKITIVLACVFLVNTLLIGLTYTHGRTSATGSIVDKLPAEAPAAAQPVQPTAAPAGGSVPPLTATPDQTALPAMPLPTPAPTPAPAPAPAAP
jgi:preprotein translocase subunit SecG